MLVPIPLLAGLSWRLIGLTALIAIPIHTGLALNAARADNWGGALYWTVGHVLHGLAILLFGVALYNLRRRTLTPVTLALAVLLGSTVASAVVELPWRLGYLVGSPLPAGSYAGDVLWLARQAALPWAFIAAAWYFMKRASARSAALNDAELARRRLETRMVEARLQVLQAQTEPHFLFNTLAHVKRLYRTDPALGRQMLDRFCDYLRAALPQMRGNGATLGRELDLACAYLDVQKIRMGRRLSFQIDVPADLRDLAFPPMMLLAVVENAVKHGLSALPEGGAIRISAAAQEGVLKVSVADTGTGFSTTRGTGIGLSNIRDRLGSLFSSSGSLSLMPNSPRGIVAAIAIPLDPAHKGVSHSSEPAGLAVG